MFGKIVCSKKITKEYALENCAIAFKDLLTHYFEWHPYYQSLVRTGGGGASMAMNFWMKFSDKFNNIRISSKAKELMVKNGYTINTYFHLKNEIEKRFFREDGQTRTIDARKAMGTFLHVDHSPTNKKVVNDLIDFIIGKDCLIEEIINYLKNIQTRDIITVEQDYLRTYSNQGYSKKDIEMMDAFSRDKLINDTFEIVNL